MGLDGPSNQMTLCAPLLAELPEVRIFERSVVEGCALCSGKFEGSATRGTVSSAKAVLIFSLSSEPSR
jgi:hypothetical protein